MKKYIFILTLSMISFTVSVNGQKYKAMTYNIRYDNPDDGENAWANRKEFLCDQVAFFAPDILGIQEGLAHQVAYLDGKLQKHTFIGIGRDDGKQKGEYSAIFYNNTKFEKMKSGTFWLSETPDQISVGWDASMERICTYALLKDKITHTKIWVFNTHFDHIGKIAREKSMILIHNIIQQQNKNNLPVILLGDFNAQPDSVPIAYITKSLNDSRTSSLAIPFGPFGTFNGFKHNVPVSDRIDYIFISKNIQVNKYAVLSDANDCRYPSDHLPVFIEFELK